MFVNNVEGKCICHAIQHCVTGGAGQFRLILAEGIKLTVYSGKT